MSEIPNIPTMIWVALSTAFLTVTLYVLFLRIQKQSAYYKFHVILPEIQVKVMGINIFSLLKFIISRLPDSARQAHNARVTAPGWKERSDRCGKQRKLRIV